MPRVPFVPVSVNRDGDGLPAVTLQNLYPVGGDDALRLFGRQAPALVHAPGTALWATVGDGPIRGLFSYPGAGGSDLYAVSGTKLYRVNSSKSITDLGTITGTDDVVWAMIRDTVLLTANSKAYFTSGSTRTEITDVDLGAPSSVAGLDGRAIFSIVALDTFKWSSIFAPGTIESLAFATAETYGDRLVRALVQDRTLYLFGERSLEIWAPTGDSVAPFRRQAGATRDVGCISAHSVATLPTVIFWVNDAPAVFMLSGQLRRISDPGIERLLAQVPTAKRAQIRGDAYQLDGHGFYQLTMPDVGTYTYHVQTDSWHRRLTGIGPLWARKHVTTAFDKVLIGSTEDGKVFEMAQAHRSDAGVKQERIANAFIPASENGTLASLVVDGFVAQPQAAAQPLAYLSLSQDDGRSWSPERLIALPTTATRRRASYGWGLIEAPGMVVRLRQTEAASATFFGLAVNE